MGPFRNAHAANALASSQMVNAGASESCGGADSIGTERVLDSQEAVKIPVGVPSILDFVEDGGESGKVLIDGTPIVQ